jgi:zinc protease
VESVPNDRLYVAFRLPADATPDFHAVGLALDYPRGIVLLAHGRATSSAQDQVVTGLTAHPMGFAGGVSLGIISADVSDGVDPGRRAGHLRGTRAVRRDGPDRRSSWRSAIAETERAWLSALAGHDDRADHI